MNEEEYPENSDTSDDDYCPEEDKTAEAVSEVESDGDVEAPLSDSEGSPVRGKKRAKTATKSRKKLKIIEEPIDDQSEKNSNLTEEEKKKKEEDIWADFMKDTGFQSKNLLSSSSSSKPKVVNNTPQKLDTKSETSKDTTDKITITQIFDFAGEEVKVEKEVSVDSAEARLLDKSSSKQPTKRARCSLGGISGVLSQLGKKPKISTLEKSKLDWDKFKKEENLDEELRNYNKGKNGYLDRQDFLQRADLRRFEIEKDIRSVERNKRLNNTL